MLGIISKAVVALGMAGATLVAVNAKSLAGPETATFAPLGPETSVPYGWVDFCQRYGANARTTRCAGGRSSSPPPPTARSRASTPP